MGFRVMLDLGPDAPRWATADGAPLGTATGNREPDPREFARFAAAVGKRYSGDYEGLPEGRVVLALERAQPPLLPEAERGCPADLPGDGRRRVAGAARSGGRRTRRCWSARPHRSGARARCSGPRDFLRRWLCLDEDFHPTPDEPGCRGFRGFDVDGYAHHPYGPTSKTPEHADIVSMLVIRRLGRYLDRAAAAGRLPRTLPIYNTEFGLQSNPPDPTARLDLDEQAAFLNEKEEQSYRYPRVRSYAQYLLYDDPAARGRHAGGDLVRLPDGPALPRREPEAAPTTPTACRSWFSASDGGGVLVWGRVRPGSGVRRAELDAEVGAWCDAWRPTTPATSRCASPDRASYRVRRLRRGRQAARPQPHGRPVAATRRPTEPARGHTSIRDEANLAVRGDSGRESEKARK